MHTPGSTHIVEDCDDLLGVENPELLWPDTVPEDAGEPQSNTWEITLGVKLNTMGVEMTD